MFSKMVAEQIPTLKKCPSSSTPLSLLAKRKRYENFQGTSKWFTRH